jgi:hypothetical protein
VAIGPGTMATARAPHQYRFRGTGRWHRLRRSMHGFWNARSGLLGAAPTVVILILAGCVPANETAGEEAGAGGHPPPGDRGVDAAGAVGAKGGDAAANATGSPSVDGAASGPGDAGAGHDAPLPVKTGPHDFKIEIDYQYDTLKFYDTDNRKALFALAASDWAQYIDADFPDLPAGVTFGSKWADPTCGDFPEGTSSVTLGPIDDLVVTVGSGVWQDFVKCGWAHGGPRTRGSLTPNALAAQLDQRYRGTPFQPWAGIIVFEREKRWFQDPTPQTKADVPRDGSLDFLSTARHELGHVLAFIGASLDSSEQTAFGHYVQHRSYGNVFSGPRTMAVYGGPVPLDADALHFDENTVKCRGLSPAMTSRSQSGRLDITALDLAVLEDVGYKIRWDRVAEKDCLGGAYCSGANPSGTSLCPAGMTCLLTPDGCASPRYACFEAGPGLEGSACKGRYDCDTGMTCVWDGAATVCRHLCSDDSECAAGYRCTGSDYCDSQTLTGYFCRQSCSGATPSGAASCGPGSICWNTSGDCAAVQFGCFKAGTGLEGSSCQGNYDCGEGVFCVAERDGSHLCRRLCDSDADCLGGLLCTAILTCGDQTAPLGKFCQ